MKVTAADPGAEFPHGNIPGSFPDLQEILDDPERAARWMAIFREECARRGLGPEPGDGSR